MDPEDKIRYIRSIRVQKNTIRMANSLYPFNYFPLVSGSRGQDSLYSFNYFTLVSGSGGQDSCHSSDYFPLISGSTTIGASLIVSVKAPLDILSLHIPDEPYDNYS